MRPSIPLAIRLTAAGAALVALAGCSADQPSDQAAGQPATSTSPTSSTSATSPTSPTGGTSPTTGTSSTPTAAGTGANPSVSPSRAATRSATSAPGAGSTASTVPRRTQQVNTPTKKLLDTKSTVAPELTAELTSLRSAQVDSTNPGEVSGNAVIFGIRVLNGTGSSVDLSNVVVTLAGANGNPGSEITTDPAKPLSGTLAAGKSASGTYVFVVAKGQRDPVTVNVTLSAGTAVAVFRGDAS